MRNIVKLSIDPILSFDFLMFKVAYFIIFPTLGAVKFSRNVYVQ